MRRSQPIEADLPRIKLVPREQSVREQIRQRAAASVGDLRPEVPPQRSDLESLAERVLEQLDLPRSYLGFAMVEVSNEFWSSRFEAVPYDRRLLLLPHCLVGDRTACRGRFNDEGILECIACRACAVRRLAEQAEQLGYRVSIFDGTPPVLDELAARSAEAILGVACLDSLDRAFDRASNLGVPNVAIPLLDDGCTDTSVDADRVLRSLRAITDAAPGGVRSYVPLLRATAALFEPDVLRSLIGDLIDEGSETDRIAVEWIETGGKRFRPFVTLAAYVAARHGPDALDISADPGQLLSDAMKAVAIAIEVLHKASLVHDDIEDADAFRYGAPTLHQRYGVPTAINIGDYLVGLGYRLISAQAAALGAEVTGDILSHLSAAHLALCRGQGAELLWSPGAGNGKPLDVLAMYALKTGPAFETALYAGLRAADAEFDGAALRRFSVYVGEAYQVLNDLNDRRGERRNKVRPGSDLSARRPTILRAFAVEAGAAGDLAGANGDIEEVRRIYESYRVFRQAEQLVDKLRGRAVHLAESQPNPALRELLLFIVRIVV